MSRTSEDPFWKCRIVVPESSKSYCYLTPLNRTPTEPFFSYLRRNLWPAGYPGEQTHLLFRQCFQGVSFPLCQIEFDTSVCVPSARIPAIRAPLRNSLLKFKILISCEDFCTFSYPAQTAGFPFLLNLSLQGKTLNSSFYYRFFRGKRGKRLQ